MAKKAAAGKSKGRKRTTKRTGAAARAPKLRVSFERLHAEIDAALEQLETRQKGARRDGLIEKLKVMRRARLCPVHSMFVEMA